jgi:chromate transporter
MHREFVEDRKWLSETEFLDLLGAVNLIPGPNSTQMAIFIGKTRAGFPGLVLAGICFILPAALLVSGCAWAYISYGSTPNVLHLMVGVKPVIIAVIAQATWNLLRATVKSTLVGGVGMAAVGMSLAGLAPLGIVFGSGAFTLLVKWAYGKRKENLRPLLELIILVASFAVFAAILSHGELAKAPFGIGLLFVFFLKVGAVLYGSGYSLLAYLNHDLVSRWGWLTKGQLLDAVAVGQFTPGPVFTTATFIGFYLGGPVGALVATIAIFLPSFAFIALSARLMPKAKESGIVRAFLDGVNVASLALMAVVALQLGETALRNWLTVAVAAASLVLLLKFRVNSAWLMAGGALIGFCGSLLGLPS